MRFLGAYSLVTGKKQDTIVVRRGITIGQLLDRLTARYGASFANRVRDTNGRLCSNFRLFLGEEDVSRLGLDKEVTTEEVTLYFLIGAAGGSKSREGV